MKDTALSKKVNRMIILQVVMFIFIAILVVTRDTKVLTKTETRTVYPSQAGESAYQIWLRNGYTGTEQDFLASLKAPPAKDGVDGKSDLVTKIETQPGINGENGMSAYELAIKHGFVGTEVEWLDSLQARAENVLELRTNPSTCIIEKKYTQQRVWMPTGARDTRCEVASE